MNENQKNGQGMNYAGMARAVPLRTGKAGKRDVRTQFAALCYRLRKKEVEVLLITSRDSGRWIIPKGWPMDRLTPAEAAAQEAFEEAGVIGKAKEMVIGLYSYRKETVDDQLPCVVAVFPLKVQKLVKDYPEMAERDRRWFPARKAAEKVREPELRQILKNFPAFLR